MIYIVADVTFHASSLNTHDGKTAKQPRKGDVQAAPLSVMRWPPEYVRCSLTIWLCYLDQCLVALMLYHGRAAQAVRLAHRWTNPS